MSFTSDPKEYEGIRDAIIDASTAEEKFDHMLRKNPSLGKLKERFNLDFE